MTWAFRERVLALRYTPRPHALSPKYLVGRPTPLLNGPVRPSPLAPRRGATMLPVAARPPLRASRALVVTSVPATRCHARPCVRAAAARAPLIERLGGPDAVKVAVDLFYKRVLADDRVKEYFSATDMDRQRKHQAAFMTYAFGGANHYSGRDMAEAHRHLVPHLTEAHFNAICEHFVSTLQELEVAQADIDDAVAIVLSTKDAVLAD